MSPDGRFLAGPVPEVPGLWVASGCNGSGFSSSPAIGEALARWITGGQAWICRPWPRTGSARWPSLCPTTACPAAVGSGSAVSSGAGNPLSDDELIERGTWQYAHYYDPLA